MISVELKRFVCVTCMSSDCKRKLKKLEERINLIISPSLYSCSCFCSVKSSHPKKTGCTTKTTPASTSTLHSRVAKDAGGAAHNGGTDARTNRKSDTPTSSVPEKASAETPSQPGELKSSPLSSDIKSASSNDTEGTRAASQPGREPKSVPKASAAGEETHKRMAPEPTVQSPHINAATEDTSFTKGELDSSSKGEKQGRTGGEGGEEEIKKEQTESAAGNSLR